MDFARHVGESKWLCETWNYLPQIHRPVADIKLFMPSKALENFRERLKGVEELLDAHGALTRLKNAEAALTAGSQTLQNVAQIVQRLLSAPRPGRPRQVQALNSAGIALLSAHLQGFLVELHAEVAQSTLGGKVQDIDALTSSARMRGNPNKDSITRLFNSIGFSNVLDGISWQRISNVQLIAKLRAFNELRNKIVHGTSVTVKKSDLENYLSIITSLAEKLDEKLRRNVRAITGADPW